MKKLVDGVLVDMTQEEIDSLPQPPAEEERLEALATEARNKRDNLLSQTDWTQVVDAPVDQTAWATYRRALRDVPAQASFPENIDWPVSP